MKEVRQSAGERRGGVRQEALEGANPGTYPWLKGSGCRGRQRLRWADGVKEELDRMRVTEEAALDRKRWRELTKAPTPD